MKRILNISLLFLSINFFPFEIVTAQNDNGEPVYELALVRAACNKLGQMIVIGNSECGIVSKDTGSVFLPGKLSIYKCLDTSRSLLLSQWMNEGEKINFNLENISRRPFEVFWKDIKWGDVEYSAEEQDKKDGSYTVSYFKYSKPLQAQSSQIDPGGKVSWTISADDFIGDELGIRPQPVNLKKEDDNINMIGALDSGAGRGIVISIPVKSENVTYVYEFFFQVKEKRN